MLLGAAHLALAQVRRLVPEALHRVRASRRLGLVAAIGTAVPLVAGAVLLLRPWAPQAAPGTATLYFAASTASSAASSTSAAGLASSTNPQRRDQLADQAGAVPAPDRAPLVGTYVVQSGDTLTSIAALYGTDVPSLESINGLTDYSILQPGQKLTVIRRVGYLYTVKSGDTLDGIASSTGVTAAALVSANELDPTNPLLVVGAKLIIPAEPKVTEPAGAPPSAQGSGTLGWPVHGVITSPFGWRPDPWTNTGSEFHNGLDIGVPTGTPVGAACPGRVILASWDGAYGEAVEVACADGLTTLYAHNSALNSHVGESVSEGQIISFAGMTGNATGPHVHLGVETRAGVWVNPLDYLGPA